MDDDRGGSNSSIPKGFAPRECLYPSSETRFAHHRWSWANDLGRSTQPHTSVPRGEDQARGSMKIDPNDSEFPRKLLDKKCYVRIDPESGEPQLVRVEPNVSEEGDFSFDTVAVTIDDGMKMIMSREVADAFIESHGCVLLEEFSDWKRNTN